MPWSNTCWANKRRGDNFSLGKDDWQVRWEVLLRSWSQLGQDWIYSEQRSSGQLSDTFILSQAGHVIICINTTWFFWEFTFLWGNLAVSCGTWTMDMKMKKNLASYVDVLTPSSRKSCFYFSPYYPLWSKRSLWSYSLNAYDNFKLQF
jgi:hypothetical protein